MWMRKVASQDDASVEWPTILLAVAVHGGWLLTTARFHALPPLLRVLAGGWLIAWHGSLQHEAIHGHPTGRRWLDALIAGVPLSLWLPYGSYRRSHRAHHRSPAITDPFDDPESRYLAAADGPRGRLRHRLADAQATLLARLLLGPAITVAGFLADEARAARRHPRRVFRDWAPHLVGVALVLAWLNHVGVGIAAYLACFVYPGVALSLLRSFAEHRAAPQAGHRVAVVERAGPFAWLFLHNNLHAAHHEAPGLAWYRLPAYYRTHRARLLAGNGGLVYAGYGDVARRFLWQRHDATLHPDHAGAAAA
jgi:fatty acid desaturase